MQRQLFLHHYFPALYFSILLLCAVFDFATLTTQPRLRLQIAAALVFVAVLAYLHWSPLTYAGVWTRGQCEKAKWLETWDFSWCARASVQLFCFPGSVLTQWTR
jgi:dolichyl-phosphate-mannose-protein mannosyltransferase